MYKVNKYNNINNNIYINKNKRTLISYLQYDKKNNNNNNLYIYTIANTNLLIYKYIK